MEKIKDFIKSEKYESVLAVLIVILTGTASFGLGRMSTRDNIDTNLGLSIEYLENELPDANQKNFASNEQLDNLISSNQTANVTNTNNYYDSNTNNSKRKLFFASKNGKTYYPLSCSAGNRIKEENKIFFSSREEAENSGYKLSRACK